MYTVETAVVLPAFLLFLLVYICVSVQYTEQVSVHADRLRESALPHTIHNTDIVRGEAVLYDIYQRHTD